MCHVHFSFALRFKAQSSEASCGSRAEGLI